MPGGSVNRPDPQSAVDEERATLHAPSGLVLAFQRVADHRPPRWPDPARPQQFPLGFGVPDLDRAQEQVPARGATLLDARAGVGPSAGPDGWSVCAAPGGPSLLPGPPG